MVDDNDNPVRACDVSGMLSVNEESCSGIIDR